MRISQNDKDSESFIGVCVINVDTYMSGDPFPSLPPKPLPRYQQSGIEAPQFPVIRLWGSTPAGQKTCLHLHGIFPYFYIRPIELLSGNQICDAFANDDEKTLQNHLESLKESIDSLIDQTRNAKIVNQSNPNSSNVNRNNLNDRSSGEFINKELKQDPPRFRRVVHQLSIVRRVNLYGYHPDPQLFIKVELFNPNLVSEVAAQLQAGKVSEIHFQPFESHISYILQAFIDHDLAGCEYAYVRKVLFRTPIPHKSGINMKNKCGIKSALHTRIYDSTTIPEEYIIAHPRGHNNFTSIQEDFSRNKIDANEKPRHASSIRHWQRQTTCELECDCHVTELIKAVNRKTANEVCKKTSSIASLEAIWEEERNRQRNMGGDSQLLSVPELALGKTQEGIIRGNLVCPELQAKWNRSLCAIFHRYGQTSNNFERADSSVFGKCSTSTLLSTPSRALSKVVVPDVPNLVEEVGKYDTLLTPGDISAINDLKNLFQCKEVQEGEKIDQSPGSNPILCYGEIFCPENSDLHPEVEAENIDDENENSENIRDDWLDLFFSQKDYEKEYDLNLGPVGINAIKEIVRPIELKYSKEDKTSGQLESDNDALALRIHENEAIRTYPPHLSNSSQKWNQTLSEKSFNDFKNAVEGDIDRKVEVKFCYDNQNSNIIEKMEDDKHTEIGVPEEAGKKKIESAQIQTIGCCINTESQFDIQFEVQQKCTHDLQSYPKDNYCPLSRNFLENSQDCATSYQDKDEKCGNIFRNNISRTCFNPPTVGTSVLRMISGSEGLRGRVIKIWDCTMSKKSSKLYRVCYEDGEEEDLDIENMKVLVQNYTNSKQDRDIICNTGSPKNSYLLGWGLISEFGMKKKSFPEKSEYFLNLFEPPLTKINPNKSAEVFPSQFEFQKKNCPTSADFLDRGPISELEREKESSSIRHFAKELEKVKENSPKNAFSLPTNNIKSGHLDSGKFLSPLRLPRHKRVHSAVSKLNIKFKKRNRYSEFEDCKSDIFIPLLRLPRTKRDTGSKNDLKTNECNSSRNHLLKLPSKIRNELIQLSPRENSFCKNKGISSLSSDKKFGEKAKFSIEKYRIMANVVLSPSLPLSNDYNGSPKLNSKRKVSFMGTGSTSSNLKSDENFSKLEQVSELETQMKENKELSNVFPIMNCGSTLLSKSNQNNSTLQNFSKNSIFLSEKGKFFGESALLQRANDDVSVLSNQANSNFYTSLNVNSSNLSSNKTFLTREIHSEKKQLCSSQMFDLTLSGPVCPILENRILSLEMGDSSMVFLKPNLPNPPDPNCWKLTIQRLNLPEKQYDKAYWTDKKGEKINTNIPNFDTLPTRNYLWDRYPYLPPDYSSSVTDLNVLNQSSVEIERNQQQSKRLSHYTQGYSDTGLGNTGARSTSPSLPLIPSPPKQCPAQALFEGVSHWKASCCNQIGTNLNRKERNCLIWFEPILRPPDLHEMVLALNKNIEKKSCNSKHAFIINDNTTKKHSLGNDHAQIDTGNAYENCPNFEKTTSINGKNINSWNISSNISYQEEKIDAAKTENTHILDSKFCNEKNYENKPKFQSHNATKNRSKIKSHAHITPPTQTQIGSGESVSQFPQNQPHTCYFRQITYLSFELYCESRENFNPHSEEDQVLAVCWCARNDSESIEVRHAEDTAGVILLEFQTDSHIGSNSPPKRRPNLGLNPKVEVISVDSEENLFLELVNVFRRFDPDIVVGWDVQNGSLGYLSRRGEKSVLKGGNLLRHLSRTPEIYSDVRNGHDMYGEDHASGIWLSGRTVLNLWRVFRGELKLQSYKQEAVVSNVLKRRHPCYPYSALREWYFGPNRGSVLKYVLTRARVNLDLLEKVGLVKRTAEMARLFGISFFEVLSRGSQFRVEAVMLKVMKPLNYVAVSPSREQVARQAAMECVPLVMEPRSEFYVDPIVVLDFQSLYPSMVIAYNMCFSTILGRLDLSDEGHTTSNNSGVGRLGVLPYLESQTSAALKFCGYNGIPQSHEEGSNQPFVAPNGAVFCSPIHRLGVLPRMLMELLKTRIMVKGAMKRAKERGEKVLERTLDARQLALKLIANVTYGYTAAGYSGRMPMAELADAIVESGRVTLENAIKTIDDNNEWGGKVVYGDTDSMFVLLKGRSIEEAFKIGKDIARAITDMNPPSVVLKLEKVYSSSLLVSKKHYVGHSIEDPKTPCTSRLDAKGIELVRRDQCPFVTKIQEKCIRLLFSTKDLSQVKSYCVRQWTKALAGKAGISDFIFQKEVKLGTYASNTYLPLAAVVASKRMAQDPALKPNKGERVPYVVIHGPPGSRLMDLVVSPESLIGPESGLSGGSRINVQYYITKAVLPALNRLFTLVGVDVKRWYEEMPRPKYRRIPKAVMESELEKKSTLHITSFFKSTGTCNICNATTVSGLCPTHSKGQLAVQIALSQVSDAERSHFRMSALCINCTGHPMLGTACNAIDCSVLFERKEIDIEVAIAQDICEDFDIYF